MRTLCTAVCLALCSTGALAADYGVGVSARSNDAWIYLPIDINKAFRIEPMVRYASDDVSQDTNTSDYAFKQEIDNIEVGVGLFRLAKVAESARIYYGIRASYVSLESTTINTTALYPGYGVTLRTESSQDGYRIGPTLGFEYLLGEHFSIGGEANYSFTDVEGDATTTATGSTVTTRDDIERKNNGTSTQLIVRYRF